MNRIGSGSLLPLSLAAALLCSGCNKTQPPPPTSQPAPAGSPAAANPPAGAAPQETPQAAPLGGSMSGPASAAAPAGTAAAPASTAATAPAMAPAVVSLVVPAGTRLSVRTTESLSAEHNGVGAGFTGVLNAPVTVHGSVALARGTAVRGEITSAKGKGRFKGAGILGIALTSVGGHTVETSEFVEQAKGRGKRTGAFVGGGAGVGALIGGLAGGGKGALIGGLSGAGAGTAATAFTGSRDVVLPAESVVAFTTRTAIKVR